MQQESFRPNQPPIILGGKPYYYNLGLDPTACPKCGEYCFIAFQLLRLLDPPTLVIGTERERQRLLNEKGYYICFWCLHREIHVPAEGDGAGTMKVSQQSDIEWEPSEEGGK